MTAVEAICDFEHDFERALTDLEAAIADIVDIDDDIEGEILVVENNVARVDVAELRFLSLALLMRRERQVAPSRILTGRPPERCALLSKRSCANRQRDDANEQASPRPQAS